MTPKEQAIAALKEAQNDCRAPELLTDGLRLTLLLAKIEYAEEKVNQIQEVKRVRRGKKTKP